MINSRSCKRHKPNVPRVNPFVDLPVELLFKVIQFVGSTWDTFCFLRTCQRGFYMVGDPHLARLMVSSGNYNYDGASQDKHGETSSRAMAMMLVAYVLDTLGRTDTPQCMKRMCMETVEMAVMQSTPETTENMLLRLVEVTIEYNGTISWKSPEYESLKTIHVARDLELDQIVPLFMDNGIKTGFLSIKDEYVQKHKKEWLIYYLSQHLIVHKKMESRVKSWVRHNQVDHLGYLFHCHGRVCHYDLVITYAAKRACVPVLEWLKYRDNHWQYNKGDLIYGAIAGGRMDVIDWDKDPIEEGSLVHQMGTHTLQDAAKHNHLCSLLWVDDNSHYFKDLGAEEKRMMFQRTCQYAAKGNSWRWLDWLRRRDIWWDEMSYVRAAKKGHVDLIRKMYSADSSHRKSRFRRCTKVCAAAAAGGSLEMLRWLYRHNFKFDLRDCLFAANGWPIKLCWWLRERGCPEGDIVTCRRGKISAILGWAYNNGWVFGDGDFVIELEQGRKHQHAIDWLHRHLSLR